MLLEARELKMIYPSVGASRFNLLHRRSDGVRAVDGVSLSLIKGETLGLVGESGSGKSTLGWCMVGLHQPTAGHVLFRGRPVTSDVGDRRHLQLIFQDPYSSLNPRMKIGDCLTELIRVHKLAQGVAIKARALELLSLVGLSSAHYDAYPRHLSGGQRQRASIARALALEPEVIVADEPVSALDVSIQATIVALLDHLKDELGLTLLFITHNLGVVRHVADRVAVMYAGRIVELAPTAELFGNPRHPYTRGLIDAVPRIDRRRHRTSVMGDPPSPRWLPSGCRFHPRCPHAFDLCSEADPPLSRGPSGDDHVAACHLAWPASLGISQRSDDLSKERP
jgi:oligopeptide transport system ATP-binding protein